MPYVGLAPARISAESASVGIEQDDRRIEAMARLGGVGSVDAVAVEIVGGQSVYENVPNIAGLVQNWVK